MAEKTYVARVAHENVKVGQRVVTEPTPRMEALLGAGYYTADEVALVVDAGVIAGADAEAEDTELLERFEELDVVEVAPERPRRRRNTE